MSALTNNEREQIAGILDRRATELTVFLNNYQKNDLPLGSVELALSREIDRLRQLSERVAPSEPEEEE